MKDKPPDPHYDFLAFLEDMGNRPSSKHSVDRKDNNGHYSCGICEECLKNHWTANCRWMMHYSNPCEYAIEIDAEMERNFGIWYALFVKPRLDGNK